VKQEIILKRQKKLRTQMNGKFNDASGADKNK
jgi:hypothetical protein